jgi:hypothetical protein
VRSASPPEAPDEGNPFIGHPGIQAFREQVREQNPILDSFLEGGTFEHNGNELRIQFPGRFFVQFEKLSENANRRVLESVCRRVFGEGAELKMALEAKAATMNSKSPNPGSNAGSETLLEKMKQEPVLRSFLETFPGKVSIEEMEK